MNATALATLIQNNAEHTDAVLSLIKKYKLESLVPSALEIIRKRQAREVKNNRTVVESAFPLDATTEANIVSMLGRQTGKSVRMDSVIVNNNLIAGFKAYTRDHIIDASLPTLLAPFYKKTL